jgi:hypothetical protein
VPFVTHVFRVFRLQFPTPEHPGWRD